MAPLESQGEDPRGPGRIRRCLEVLGRPAHRRSTAELRRHRPAGGERGKVRGSEAAVGSRTYVPSARWGRLRETGVQGALGRSHHAAAPGRAGQRRAGQGRAGLRAAPSAAGVCLSLEARAGPSSRCRAEANGAPSPPTHRAASPPGWPPGRAGERGCGGLGSGLPSGGFPGKRRPGARSRPGRRRLRIQTEAAPHPHPHPPRRPGWLSGQVRNAAPWL